MKYLLQFYKSVYNCFNWRHIHSFTALTEHDFNRLFYKFPLINLNNTYGDKVRVGSRDGCYQCVNWLILKMRKKSVFFLYILFITGSLVLMSITSIVLNIALQFTQKSTKQSVGFHLMNNEL